MGSPSIQERLRKDVCSYRLRERSGVDGHEYVKQALAAGITASFWQRDAPNPPDDLPIIIVENTEKATSTIGAFLPPGVEYKKSLG